MLRLNSKTVNTIHKGVIVVLSLRTRKRGADRLGDLPKVTQLVRGYGMNSLSTDNKNHHYEC